MFSMSTLVQYFGVVPSSSYVHLLLLQLKMMQLLGGHFRGSQLCNCAGPAK